MYYNLDVHAFKAKWKTKCLQLIFTLKKYNMQKQKWKSRISPTQVWQRLFNAPPVNQSNKLTTISIWSWISVDKSTIIVQVLREKFLVLFIRKNKRWISPPAGHFMRELLKEEKFPTNPSWNVCPHASPPSGGDALLYS